MQFFIAFIHEMFHVLGALIFKVDIEKIEFLPFGFYVHMANLYTKKWYQELIITIMGPLSFFVSIYVIKLLFIHDYISYIGYIEANNSNLFILIFNLLPIYPLDGGIILRLLLEKFFTQKKAMKILGSVSILVTIFIIIYTLNNPQLILIGYLVYCQIEFWLYFKRKYNLFLIARSGKAIESKDILHSRNDLYRPKNNLIIKGSKIYDEGEYARYLLGLSNK